MVDIPLILTTSFIITVYQTQNYHELRRYHKRYMTRIKTMIKTSVSKEVTTFSSENVTKLDERNSYQRKNPRRKPLSATKATQSGRGNSEAMKYQKIRL